MRAFFRRHPILASILGAITFIPLARLGAGDGPMLFAFWGAAIPIALSAAQALSTYGNKPRAQPFQWIPPSKREQFANKLEKGFWRGMAGKYTGAPVPVYRTMDQARGDYATSDVLGQGRPVDRRFSGATARALAQAQDSMAQEASMTEGLKRHAWALSGKMAQSERRADMQSAINAIHASVIGQNKAAEQGWRQAVNTSLWNFGSTVAGSLGNYLGSKAGTTATPSTATPAPGAPPPTPYQPSNPWTQNWWDRWQSGPPPV